MNRHSTTRTVMLCLLLALIAIGLLWLFGTAGGKELRGHPEDFQTNVRQYIHQHPILAPMEFMALFIVLTMLCLPVWFLQLFAGYGFGLTFGILYCQIGAIIGSVAGAGISRWLLGDWFHQRVESRLEKLQKLDTRMGHNGLLVVMTVRLLHVFPFGLSNYLFGLSRITLRDIALGTALGCITLVVEVAIGARGESIWHDWPFWVIAVTANIVLLVPVALRYLRPNWFKKIGVE